MEITTLSFARTVLHHFSENAHQNGAENAINSAQESIEFSYSIERKYFVDPLAV